MSTFLKLNEALDQIQNDRDVQLAITEREAEAQGVLLVDAYAFDVKPEEIRYWQKKETQGIVTELQKEQELSPTQIFARDIVAAMES